MTVENKVVIITGASSGIGEATAKLLAQKGAKVVVGARREDRLQKLVAEIKADGGEATYSVLDVASREDNEKIVKVAIDTYGKVDVIFLNAGIMPNSPLSALEVDKWDEMIDINIKGVLNGIAAVMPHFTAQKSGHVITTSSVAGLKVYQGCAVYSATKFAVKTIMETLRMESAAEGTNIRTATLYPGAINTELLNSISDKDTAAGMGAFYEKVGITPDRVANVVLFAIDQPEDVNVSEFAIWPTKQI